MKQEIIRAADERLGTQPLPTSGITLPAIERDIRKVGRSRPPFQPLQYAAIILGLATACGHLGLWWYHGGRMESDDFLPSIEKVQVLGLHVISLFIGLVLVAESFWGPTGGDRRLAWIGLMITLLIFVAGISFFAFGWVDASTWSYP